MRQRSSGAHDSRIGAGKRYTRLRVETPLRRPDSTSATLTVFMSTTPSGALAGSGTLSSLIEARFGENVEVPEALERDPELTGLAAHRSHRSFTSEPVPPVVLRALLAAAFSAPAKSDLQQSCVVHVSGRSDRERIAALIPSMPWIADAPVLLVFCGDNRRIRRICALRGIRFANDHFDSFFNAAVDAGLVMAGFIRAAQAAGLGCCPLSAVRNHADEVSRMLELPDYVFPVAGVVAGYPAKERKITPRLPLDAFVHVDRYDDGDFEQWIASYDERRHAALPLGPGRQRDPVRFGRVGFYGWSEDKARQVAVSECHDFGDFVRSKRFRLD